MSNLKVIKIFHRGLLLVRKNVHECDHLEMISPLLSGWILTVITLMAVTDVPPLVDHVDAGLDAELAVRVSASPPPPHREAVHRVVVELLILVQEGVVHGQLLLRVELVVVVPREVALCMNILVGPVARGGGEGWGGFPLEVVEQAGRRGLHNQVVSDGSVLEITICISTF